ncbi:pyocin [Obesumbacterium proteus]|uniref:S-type pyocin domain-containing protein n=1 Tax=Obesumbacterium proteus TaxID=82983 RepID=UPI001033427E|nr:S-type pyocin domain-containing protein [Obesumbacterium proteus]TBL71787.1 pyocin [Obesumbacterium proteus]
MNRMSVYGKGQGLHGDKTTTGAMCITSLPNASENNRGVLRIDDVTTACPKCGKVGRIISGDARATYNGRATAVDGALVLCGCPNGSNRLIAPLGRLASERSSSVEQPPTSMAQQSAQVAKKPEVETMTAEQDKGSTPVFAKSRERGDGNTEAGTEPETHENFALMGYFRAVPEPEQHAQSAKRPASPPPEPEKPWYKKLFGGASSAAPAVAVPVAASTVFPSGSAALEWVGGRFITAGSWAVRAVVPFGEIAAAGAGAPIAVALIGMMPRTLNSGEQDFINQMRLAQLAESGGKAPTRVRFRWEDDGHGRLSPKGYHTPTESGLSEVPVREMKLNTKTGLYEFTTEGVKPVTIYWNPDKLELDIPSNTGHQDSPSLPSSITVLPIPEKVGSDIESYPAPTEGDFEDYILIFLGTDMPPIYVYLSKPPVEFLEVELYSDFKRRSRQGKYEADHMPSAAAVRAYLRKKYPKLDAKQLDRMAKDVASIVIPKEVHHQVSETFGKRNNPEQIESDARDLRAAADHNLDAIKPALKEHGATNEQIEVVRQKMHKLNDSMGLYK